MSAKIIKFVKNSLWSDRPYPDGDYETNFDFDFILNKKCECNIFGTEFIVDRICMYSVWGGEIALSYKDLDNNLLKDIPVNKKFIPQILQILEAEEKKGGELEGYLFSDDEGWEREGV